MRLLPRRQDGLSSAGKARQEARGEDTGTREALLPELAELAGVGAGGCKAQRVTRRTHAPISGQCGSSARGWARLASASGSCSASDALRALSQPSSCRGHCQSSHWPAQVSTSRVLLFLWRKTLRHLPPVAQFPKWIISSFPPTTQSSRPSPSIPVSAAVSRAAF